MTRSEEQRDALQSAVQRLPLGVVTFDSKGNVRMMNRAASEIFEREGIPMDVMSSRPSHPVARLLAAVFEGTETAKQIVTLGGGAEYEIEPSHRSEKEGDRLVMLLMRKLVGGTVREPTFEDWELTRREQEVAKELTAGRSSREMTEKLGISSETLKSHLANMMRKTQTRSRAELVALLLKGR
jgi:DNA-binding CsgD family transcriptional regulator